MQERINTVRHQWLMLIIPATWEAEIRRILVQGQPMQMVYKTPPPSNNQSKNGLEVWFKG
jgi:hypothetical protein